MASSATAMRCAFTSSAAGPRLQRQQRRSGPPATRRSAPVAAAQLADQASLSPWDNTAAAFVATGVASLLLLGGGVLPAEAAGGRNTPIPESTAERCSLAELDKFASTRAQFSAEASGGNMTEANVDIRGCDYSQKDLRTKVLSGVQMQESDFSGADLTGIQFARAQAQGAALRGTNMKDVNAYSTAFDGADLENAQFENAILSSASFGKYQGKWANLKGASFESALLSSSDVVRICENPTLDDYTRKAELGCRKSR